MSARRPSSARPGAPRRGLVALLLCLALALPLAGCAKKNAPVPPEGVPDTFHRVYPSE